MTAIAFALITAALFGAAPIPAGLGLAKVGPALDWWSAPSPWPRCFRPLRSAGNYGHQIHAVLSRGGVLASVLRTWPTSMPCGRAKPPKWSPWWSSCWESSCWAKRPRLTAGSEPPSLWWG